MLPAESVELCDLLDRRILRPVYQPIFDLFTGDQVAVEGLARWPELDIRPDRAFQWATEHDWLAELDEACRNAAIDGAVAHGLPEGFGLFVNIEPSVLTAEVAERLLTRVGHAQLVIEITERALLHRPADLLHAIRNLRAAGCAIALDDVGAVPESLALLPFVAPDVIKLDISLVQRWPDVDQAAILTTVAAYSELTGATVLAEGIENETHLRQALALGATLGQGWYLGRPGPLCALGRSTRGFNYRPNLAATPGSPYLLADPAMVRVAPKGLLLGISEHLENKGLALETPPVVLGAFQEASRFTPATARRYARLAARCPLVAALGVGLSAAPIPGVRGAPLPANDPLSGEWVVAVVGAHYTGALIARDLGDGGPDLHRRFAFVLTHNPDTVLAAARSLLQRVTPVVGSPLTRDFSPRAGSERF